MEKPTRIIIVDDDLINNMICRHTIKNTKPDLEVLTFNIPEKGFEFIENEYAENEIPTILFLDINMPTWSGWDFLDHFEKLDENIKKQIKIYMLSSSVDPSDKERADNNKNVVDYIEKPLIRDTLIKALSL